jgi:protein-tyrosine-phosphatase/GNAT superfamily N-acetyltransferase
MVLFVCLENVARSQMAQAFYEVITGREAMSAGVRPARSFHPLVLTAMLEVGIDLRGRPHRALDDAMIATAELVVRCIRPDVDEYPWPADATLIDWEFLMPDETNPTLEQVRRLRDDIRARVRETFAPTFAVRRVVFEDVSALRTVRLRALESDPLAFGSTHAREDAFPQSEWERWARDHASGSESATFFASSNGRVIGIVSAKRKDDSCHVFSMWVEPRARRLGVGSALIETTARWATKAGAKRLELWVTQPGARAMYERLGFVDDGRRMPLAHTPDVIEYGMTRTL